ncbi:plasmid mobilization protein [Noviherbaspirillum aridicola]|uniref:Mobilization protein MobC n=1 Tax=Noviherbaspirillum aridicola TaxID=2849687 RepID=A0ABQ4Q628_9BURK|nr:hypothetical protein [Noviherbaspirillum aridicola]GIZ52494.1 hypothetical protein NCCP691_25080 [Noviherbaspirillum aridicola]
MDTKHDAGSKRKLEATVACRLTQGEYDALLQKCQTANLRLSEYLRRTIIGNETVIRAAPRLNYADRRLLSLYSALGNNMNQISKRLHFDHLNGLVTNDTYQAVLEQLHLINRILCSRLPP